MTANNGVKLAFVISEASIWQPKEAGVSNKTTLLP
jgi:hypothetical protein